MPTLGLTYQQPSTSINTMATLIHHSTTTKGDHDIFVNLFCEKHLHGAIIAKITVVNKATQNLRSYKVSCNETDYPLECNNFPNFISMIKTAQIVSVDETPEVSATVTFQYQLNKDIAVCFKVVANYVPQTPPVLPTLKTIVDVLQNDLTNIIDNIYVTNEEIYKRIPLHENQTRFLTFNQRDIPITFPDAIKKAKKDFDGLDAETKDTHRFDFDRLIERAKYHYKLFLQKFKTNIGQFVASMKEQYVKYNDRTYLHLPAEQILTHVTYNLNISVPAFSFANNKILTGYHNVSDKSTTPTQTDLILHHSNWEQIRTKIIADVDTGFSPITVKYEQYCIFTGGYDVEVYLNKTDFEHDMSILFKLMNGHYLAHGMNFSQFVNLFTHGKSIDFSRSSDEIETRQSANLIRKILDNFCEEEHYCNYLADI